MIKVEHISKEFSSNMVLKDVSMSVSDGEIYGLVGKNGAGKTTLFNIMSGICEQTSGDLWIDGKKMNQSILEKGKIGYLPDLPSFYDLLTVNEYFDFLESGSKEKHSENLTHIITVLDLDRNERIKRLSRGNRQKLGIVSALLGNPRVLLFDEPTSALDSIGRKDIMQLIKNLKDSGMAIIFSTHILSDLEMVCDKVGFLHNGVISKEVDLNSTFFSTRCYEIMFCFAEDINHELLINEYAKWSCTFEGNKLLINVDDDNKMIQDEILFKLSRLPYKVIKLAKRKTYDLEHVMEEILRG